MIRAFTLSGYDNDSFMCSSTDRVFDYQPDLNLCPKCGYRTDFEYINSDFKVKRRTNDISYTYDGYCIVSLKFKEACVRYRFKSLLFVLLPGDNEYFHFIPSCVVEFDSEKRKTRFENKCQICGNYESITGATPAFIRSPLTAEICKSDLLFGSGNAKSPVLFVTEEAKINLERKKLKGLIFNKVRS
jgi:hypothetical protein